MSPINVDAIIREVFEELATRPALEATPWPPDRLQPIRRRYLDPFFDGYNARPLGDRDATHRPTPRWRSSR